MSDKQKNNTPDDRKQIVNVKPTTESEKVKNNG